MAAPPTVISQKTSFLEAQTRLLSQPLAPSRSWQSTNDDAEDGISDKALDDALFRLNQLLQQHSRRVHPPQATRHIAEQIDKLFWNLADRAADRDSEEAHFALGDLTNPETIEALPAKWEKEQDVNTHPTEAQRYSELVSRLQSLNERKSEVQSKVMRLRQICDLMEPFQADEEGRGVQENLVTRNGEVEKELERMRMLLARVGGRVGHLMELRQNRQDGRGSSQASDLFGGDRDAVMVDDVEVEERRKVDDLLGRF